jgi:trans-2,3-dihydro-3-hydroxyanthranilic acid synthase
MPGIPAIASYPLPASGELPDNVAPWVADPDRAVLLIHDMQRFFLRPFPDSVRNPLVAHAVALLDRCRAQGVPVGYTAQPGGMTDEQRGLLKDFWGPGMRVDPADRAVVAELAPGPDDWVFTKWRYSAFFRSDLLARMRECGRDQLIVCGVFAHIGCLATAVDALSHDVQPFLIADATADFTRADHLMALDYAARRCAVTMTTAELLGVLPPPPSRTDAAATPAPPAT